MGPLFFPENPGLKKDGHAIAANIYTQFNNNKARASTCTRWSIEATARAEEHEHERDIYNLLLRSRLWLSGCCGLSAILSIGGVGGEGVGGGDHLMPTVETRCTCVDMMLVLLVPSPLFLTKDTLFESRKNVRTFIHWRTDNMNEDSRHDLTFQIIIDIRPLNTRLGTSFFSSQRDGTLET